MRAQGRVRPAYLCLLLALLTFAWFAALVPRHLAKTDEGRYAEIPREMVASGDWLTPRLDGLKYFEKPALQYWATATIYKVVGMSDWSSRFWTGLTGFLGIFVVGATAGRLYGRATALYSGAVLGSSLLYVLLGHIDTLDMGLTFFTTAGLCAALWARQSPDVRSARYWMLACWAALALAVLSKGLIGIVLPGAVFCLYLMFTRDWEFLRRIEPWRGPLLFFGIAAPWFVAVSVINPGFARFFFIYEHFERFLTTSHHRVGPWWYFVPILALGMLPWTLLLPQAIWQGFGRQKRLLWTPESHVLRFRPDLLLSLWSVFIFLFFSISSSKLPSYILPIWPALAILLARTLVTMKARILAWHSVMIAMLALGLLVAGTLAERFAPHSGLDLAQIRLEYRQFGHWVVMAALLWLGGAIGCWFFSRRGAQTVAIMILACASTAGALTGLVGYGALDRVASAYYVGQALKGKIGPDTRLFSVEMYEQTLPFYLQRTMTLVNQRDELDFGLRAEPEKGIATIADFAQVWRALPSAIAVMPPTTFEKLAAMGLPLHVILSDRRFVVVSRS